MIRLRLWSGAAPAPRVLRVKVLDESEWRARAAAHAQRLEPYVAPHLARRETRVKHPVPDFPFPYYSQRPAQLMRWPPGFGVAPAGTATGAAQVRGSQAPPE